MLRVCLTFAPFVVAAEVPVPKTNYRPGVNGCGPTGMRDREGDKCAAALCFAAAAIATDASSPPPPPSVLRRCRRRCCSACLLRSSHWQINLRAMPSCAARPVISHRCALSQIRLARVLQRPRHLLLLLRDLVRHVSAQQLQ